MRANTPEIITMKPRTVLTVTTVGTPGKVAQPAISALYGTAYGTKFKVYRPKGKKMDITYCSCLWPDAQKKPKSKWTGIWAVEVSPFVKTKDLLQKDQNFDVRVEQWQGGTVAQILHLGSYSTEGPTIKKLHAFIRDRRYAIAGSHEEVYLTKPTVKIPKTIIRYMVKKAKKS
jgi:hypothetical protein